MSSARWQALGLSLFTVAYNVGEAGVAIWGAQVTGSNALFGFGLDSLVESLSGCVMVWRFARYGVDRETPQLAQLEQRSSKLVAISFFVLGLYVIVDSVLALIMQEKPDAGWIGLFIASASIVVMPLLFIAKYRLGKSIPSPSLVADSKETLACVFLSAALLVGAAATHFLHVSWVDSLAAIVIACFILREGWETWEESRCEDD